MKWRVPDGLLFTAYVLPLFSLSVEGENFMVGYYVVGSHYLCYKKKLYFFSGTMFVYVCDFKNTQST